MAREKAQSRLGKRDFDPPPPNFFPLAIDLQSAAYKAGARIPAFGNVPKHVEKSPLYLIHFPGFVGSFLNVIPDRET